MNEGEQLAFLERASENSGLSLSAVEELFNKGWSFVRAANQPRKWVGPENNISKVVQFEPKK